MTYDLINHVVITILQYFGNMPDLINGVHG